MDNPEREKQIRRQILRILAKKPGAILEREQISFQKIQEIRMRVGAPFCLWENGAEQRLPSSGGSWHMIQKQEIEETLSYSSRYSLYAYAEEMEQGFLTVEGGHRIGVTGKGTMEQGRLKQLQYISALNIRVAHEVFGVADRLFPWVVEKDEPCHTLLISPPGCGKTTLLRDLIRQLSDGNRWIRGRNVAVADERSELGACHLGIPQNTLGSRTDLLDGCAKGQGVLALIRSMTPAVIAVDEIGAAEELQALRYAMYCGCKLLATAHGRNLQELFRKPYFKSLLKEGWFERYVILRGTPRIGTVAEIYDETMTKIYDGSQEKCGSEY